MVCFDHLHAERYRNVFLISFKVDHKTTTSLWGSHKISVSVSSWIQIAIN